MKAEISSGYGSILLILSLVDSIRTLQSLAYWASSLDSLGDFTMSSGCAVSALLLGRRSSLRMCRIAWLGIRSHPSSVVQRRLSSELYTSCCRTSSILTIMCTSFVVDEHEDVLQQLVYSSEFDRRWTTEEGWEYMYTNDCNVWILSTRLNSSTTISIGAKGYQTLH